MASGAGGAGMKCEAQGCGAEVTNGLALCQRCQRTLSVALTNLPAYHADVLALPAPTSVKVSTAYKSTPPSGFTVGDPTESAMAAAENTISTWARVLADDRPQAGDPPTSFGVQCGWLEHHVPTIATLAWAGELLANVRTHERRLKAILDRADTGRFVGICGGDLGQGDDAPEVGGLTCQRGLYAAEGQTWIKCPECGAMWDAHDRHKRLLREARGQLAPVSVIARAVVGLLDHETSVQRVANRIDQWVRRGRLQSLGVRVLEDRKPHRVYRIGDVFDLLKADAPDVQPGERDAC